MTSWLTNETRWLKLIGDVAYHSKLSPMEVAEWPIPAVLAYSRIVAEILEETSG